MSAIEAADALLAKLREEYPPRDDVNVVHSPRLGDPPLGTRGGRLIRAHKVGPDRFEFMVPARWLDVRRNQKEYG